MREPEPLLMRFIAQFAGNIGDHGEAARDHRAGGRAQRMQIGLAVFGAYIKIRERLAVDLHRDFFIPILDDLDLR